MTGTFVSIHNGEVEAEKVVLNNNGEITSQSKLRNASGTIRFALPPSDPNAVLRRPQPVAPPAGVMIPITRQQNAFRPGTWNEVEILLDSDIIRGYLNDSSFSQKGTLSAATDDSENDFGPIALYVGKNTSVTFKNVAYKDLALIELPKDEVEKDSISNGSHRITTTGLRSLPISIKMARSISLRTLHLLTARPLLPSARSTPRKP
jgi:hypothetical protein